MRTHDRAIILVAVALIIGGVGIAPVAGSDYSLSADDDTEIPERTFEYEGDEFAVDSIVQRSPGESITVQSSGHDGESYDLNFRNADGDFVASASPADSTETFSTDNRDPGTYAIILATNQREAILPVVIAGYEVTVEEIPAEAESGSTITVELAVTATELSGQPDSVEVVLGNGQETLRVDASQGSDGSYTADVPLDGLDAGTYSVYGVTLIDSDASEVDQELVGLSSVQKLDVTESSTDDSTDDSQTSGGGGTDGGTDDGTPTSTTATATPTNGTATETATPDGSTATSTATETESTEPTESPDGTESSPTATATDDGVITPNGTDTRTPDEVSEQPGFAPLTAFVALLSLAGLLAKRRD